MDRKIFKGLVLGILILFVVEENVYAAGKPVFDATSNAQLIKQLEVAREQIDQMRSQIQETQRMSNAIQNPHASGQMLLSNMMGPISSDISQLAGLQNDFQKIVSAPKKGGGALPQISLGRLQSSTQFVRDNFLSIGHKDQGVLTQKDHAEFTRRRAAIQKEATIKGTALSWSEKEAIEKDLKNLELLAGKISQSKDVRTDLQIGNELKVFEIRQLIHVRTINAALLENFSTMMLSGVE